VIVCWRCRLRRDSLFSVVLGGAVFRVFRILAWNPCTRLVAGRTMRLEGLKLLVEAEFVDSSEFFIRECGVGQGSDIVENLLWF
jgi:hypothetical protein